MRTERLYYDYASPEPFEAEIREIRLMGDRAAILLDKTIFYPEGGGQDADRGSINGAALLDVREAPPPDSADPSGPAEKGKEILHFVPAAEAAKLSPGRAELLLDARRRRDLTVHHSAQHLLSGTILRLTGKYTLSMHLGAELCTIDVDAPELSKETLLRVEDAVMDAIEADAPLVIHHCPPEDIRKFPLRKVPPRGEEVIRVVEIAGHDFSPCCGAHCRSTAEIGILRILAAEKYKGMTRISFIAGRRVLLDSRLLRQNGETVSRALKVPVMETGAGVLSLLEKTAGLERDLKAYEEAEAETLADALLEKAAEKTRGQGQTGAEAGDQKPPLIAGTYDRGSIEKILRIGRRAQKKTGALLVLASREDRKFAAFCAAKGADIRPLLKEPLERHGGRGGGGPSFFQGAFETPAGLAAFMGDLGEMRPIDGNVKII
ncbi:MAG: alanyl-tRNA editing protein [Treponema sp.]|jgi:alanyl-tRNA synthetase|nr:alanyl-tRNA editing protein [Treponema sp.]